MQYLYKIKAASRFVPAGVLLGLFMASATPFAVFAGSVGAGGVCSTDSDCVSGMLCVSSTGVVTGVGIGSVKTCQTPTGAINAVQKDIGNGKVSHTCPDGSTGLCNPLKVNSIQALLTDVLGFLVQIGTVIIVLMLIWTGFKFVWARGNPGELEKARTMLMWTVIGALIILGAEAISIAIQTTVNALSA